MSGLESDPQWVPPTPGDTVDEGRSFAAVARALFKSAPAAPRVGRYYLLERLGQGGMGVVYVGYDPTLERRVAIKFLRNRHRGGERLLEEGRALANLVHPNVVAVHEVAEDGDGVYLVMAHIEGKTLDAWLRAEARGWREVLRVFVDAGRGLAAVHEAGLAHRDVKPSNLLIDAHGQVRVADFGLAVRVEPGGVEARGGTEAYMAPEQVHGDRVGPAADQYALCLCMLEAFVGRRPTAPDPSGWRRAAAERDPDGEAPPPSVFAALARGLEDEPSARHASTRALLEALDIRADTPRHPAVWLAGGLVLGMIGLLAGLAFAPEVGVGGGQSEPCASVEHTFAQTRWAGRRERVMSVERARDPQWSLALRNLDDYADRWDAVHHEGCVAHAQGRLSAVGLDDRNRCLERVGRDFDGMVGLLADEASLDGEAASDAAAGLVRPEACEVPRSVLELTMGGFSTERDAPTLALERDIAMQWTRSRLGLPFDHEAADLERRAASTGDLALRADVYRFLAENTSEVEEKRRLTGLAVRAGLAGRAQVMLAASFIDQGRINEWHGDFADAHTSFDLAGATIAAVDELALDFPALNHDAQSLKGQRRLAMGNLARREGRLEDHLADQRAALEHFVESGLDLPMREATAWLNVGEAHRLLGQASDAAEAYGRAIELARPLVPGDDRRLQAMFNNRGAMRQEFGDWAGARADYARVLRSDERPQSAAQAQVSINLALMAAERGELEEAARHCRAGQGPIGPNGPEPAPVLMALFEVHCLSYELRLGRVVEDMVLQQAYEGLRDHAGGDPSFMVLAQLEMGRAMLHRSRFQAAKEWVARARVLVKGMDTLDIASVDVLAGHVATAQGDLDAAREAYTRAVQHFDTRGLSTHPRLVEPLAALGRMKDGANARSRAQRLATQHGVREVLP